MLLCDDFKFTTSKCLFFLAYANGINLFGENFNTSHTKKTAVLHDGHLGLEIKAQEAKYML